MKILLVGVQEPGSLIKSGVNTFNLCLARALRELGHETWLGIPRQAFAAPNVLRQSSAKTGCRSMLLSGIFERDMCGFETIVVSGAGFDYKEILQSARGRRVIIWTHGIHSTPFATWNIETLRQYRPKIACCNEWHMEMARRFGLEEQAVRIDFPVPFRQRETLPAGEYCVAVGRLDPLKNYPRIGEIADALGMKCKVYGPVIDKETMCFVSGHPWLEYCGSLQHDKLLDAVAGAAYLLHAATVEGRPLAALEAMGLGVPGIYPNTPLYKEFMDPVRNILLDPSGPVAGQLAGIDLEPYRKIANRQALAAETQERFGLPKFRERLAEILGD